MNAAHIHLMVNHLPLFAALFGGGLLAYGLLRKQRALRSCALPNKRGFTSWCRA